MHRITNNRLLENNVRIFRHSGRQIQSMVENYRAIENIPELKIGLASSVIEPEENIVKTKLFIKNMVSLRCKMVVKAMLENLGLHYSTVELGEVEIIGKFPVAKQEQLKSDLLKCGLELMVDKKIILVEKIKKVIVEIIHYSEEIPKINFSDYLSKKLNYDYKYLSNLFSEVKGMSIQHFTILHKIERVKELLVYDELSLKEISYRLHYSSVSHLSNQFKKVTGLTASHFKNMKHKRRTLENI